MEPEVDFTNATWRKSSRSSASGPDCVEIALVPVGAGVRDSKNPAGPVLGFEGAAWGRFLGATKLGGFDLA
ncbi:DUF397 domain-containing protein [Umezawaea sp. Da 62-37]|nr:DUF397 domain-containing protein [Umezawaea sp. Da 62-37]WNV89629.1 DUF397 domain-containing protein [Umezawaea sp. Da 62-37]